MPLAKSAPSEVPDSATDSNLTEISNNPQQSFTVDNLPIDLARYFSVNPFKADDKSKKQLTDILKWSQPEGEDLSLGDVLQKLRKLEQRLGTPTSGETRQDKVWNYLKMDSYVKEARKRRDSLIRNPFNEA